ncbi:hypothetical protein [Ramlibacter sp.]|uniref:hypothetical protein n=1 Tax=Ramlibacter sp. TaxID=1917967 RepID=UPI003D0BBB2E
MKKLMSLMLAVAAAALLPACSDGDDDPLPTVAAANTAISVSSTTAGAVANTPFAFPTGVAAFGTTAATSVAFTSTATTPAFSISSGANVATGATTFGSCIFVVASSNFPAGHTLANGATVTVNPCALNLATANQPADGVGRPRTATLQLGGTTSTGQNVAITVNANGTVVINNTIAGNVTLVQVSG